MDTFTSWLERCRPDLSLGDVHVWYIRLDEHLFDCSLLDSVLSQDESDRAIRYRFQSDQIAFKLARGTLRLLLSQYLKCPPQSIEFSYGLHGKPFVSFLPNSEDACFSLSHAGGYAAYALTRQRKIGIDIERITYDFDPIDVGLHVFSRLELANLQRLGPPHRSEYFFRQWTRKEALVKGIGSGLSMDLRELTVLPQAIEHSGAVSGWTLIDLDPMPGMVGALAVEGKVAGTSEFRHNSLSY